VKRIAVFCIVLLLASLSVPTVSAGKPGGDLQFTLTFWGPPEWEFVTQGPTDSGTCKHVKSLYYGASGGVEFASTSPYAGLMGTFSYEENISVNPGQSTATEQGNLTLSFGGAQAGSISIRFVGRSKMLFASEPWDCHTPPTAIIVTEQPWNITGGTGYFAGIHGNGTRSTTQSGAVEYYGEIRP